MTSDSAQCSTDLLADALLDLPDSFYSASGVSQEAITRALQTVLREVTVLYQNSPPTTAIRLARLHSDRARRAQEVGRFNDACLQGRAAALAALDHLQVSSRLANQEGKRKR